MRRYARMKIFIPLFLCVPFFLISPQRVSAGEPTNEVRQSVDAVIKILKNKELKKPGKAAERRADIRKAVGERFDFEEMAKRSLSIYWRKRTPEEKKEFVSLFSDLIENTYIRKIEKYTDEKIVYTGEKIDGPYAVVRTSVITAKETEIPIDYRLLTKDGKWVAYDVVIEGVSLVNNYRNQFNQIINSGSYENLVKKLKDKTIKEPK